MKPYPPLREIQAVQVEHEGRPVICLYDPAEYIEEQIALSPLAFFVATCLDGHRDAQAIQQEVTRVFEGAQVDLDEIETVVGFLDEQGFLLSERFIARINEIQAAFQAAPVRLARLADKGYPGDAATLREAIDAFFTRDDGPGALPGPPRRRGRPPAGPDRSAH